MGTYVKCIFEHFCDPKHRNVSTPSNRTFSKKCESFSHRGFWVLNGPLTSLKHPYIFENNIYIYIYGMVESGMVNNITC